MGALLLYYISILTFQLCYQIDRIKHYIHISFDIACSIYGTPSPEQRTGYKMHALIFSNIKYHIISTPFVVSTISQYHRAAVRHGQGLRKHSMMKHQRDKISSDTCMSFTRNFIIIISCQLDLCIQYAGCYGCMFWVLGKQMN